MDDQKLFTLCLFSLYVSSLPTLVSLLFLQAPYGKHIRPGWGPTISPPLAWFIMESPTIWLSLALFPLGRNSNNLRAIALMSPFLVHYFHRTLIYPLRIHLACKAEQRTDAVHGFPAVIAAMGLGFNVLNSYLQTRWVSHYKDYEADAWFWCRFGGGLLVFTVGMWVNVWADATLLRMKRRGGRHGGDGGGGYVIPRGGLYEVVSCPNYLGEMVEWLGWSWASWSWAGFGFFFYTCANLIPRARANHMWYLKRFKDKYPKGRKTVIPFFM